MALLRWQLDQGDTAAAFLADVAEEDPEAAALAARFQPPEDAFMPPGAEFAWEAFWRLHHDRPHVVTGFAVRMGAIVIEPRPGRIPFGALDRYARRFGIVGSAFDLLAELVGRLDHEFLAWDAERARQRAAARG